MASTLRSLRKRLCWYWESEARVGDDEEEDKDGGVLPIVIMSPNVSH